MKPFHLKTWHCLTLLALAVLLAYYPNLNAGFNSVDDMKIVKGIDSVDHIDYLKNFFPNHKRYYYRPLSTLTFHFDRELWGLAPGSMHMGNILFHICNSFLVFLIARRLALHIRVHGDGLPLLAGLFFGLHPVVTESVSWISGRTDPLMTIFLLAAVWMTLTALQTRRVAAGIAAGLTLLLSPLAKETGVFILPGLLWLILVYPGESSWLRRLAQRFWLLAATSLGIVAYFLMRTLAVSRDTGVSAALKGVAGNDFEMFDRGRIALKVYGFYFKKLFVPWPLNFGIVEISDWYVLAGLVLAGLLLYLFWRADVPGAFGLMAFCVLSPALLVIFGKMTWTPIAERYMYASVALVAPLFALYVHHLRTAPLRSYRLHVDSFVAILLLVFFASTLHRAWVWQDNERLFADTVAKSPAFAAAKAELATALMQKNKIEEAEAILQTMQSDGSPAGYLVDNFNLALIMTERGDLEDARGLLLPHLDKGSKKYFDLLQSLLRINDRRIGATDDAEQKMSIQQESLDWLNEQLRLRPNSAFILYRTARMHLAMGDKEAALATFRQSLAKAPADAYYRGAVETFIKNLEKPE